MIRLLLAALLLLAAHPGHAQTLALPSDGDDLNAIVRAIEPNYPASKFCRREKDASPVVHVGQEDWAKLTLWNKRVCTDPNFDDDSYQVVLRRKEGGAWTVACEEQRGDLPDYAYYRVQCGGMPKVAYEKFFGFSADVVGAALPSSAPGPNATAQEIAEYCQKVGNTDPTGEASKYPGQDNTIWRCSKKEVYLCTTYSGTSAGVRRCSRLNTSIIPTDAIRDFCRTNPKANAIPMSVARNYALRWKCNSGEPEMAGAEPVDDQGYLKSAWSKVSPPGAEEQEIRTFLVLLFKRGGGGVAPVADAELAILFKKNKELSSDGIPMSAEINACACEDASGAQYTIRGIQIAEPTEATATYDATYSGETTSFKLTLRKEDGQWRIHDMGAKTTPNLRASIEKENKELVAQKQSAPAGPETNGKPAAEDCFMGECFKQYIVSKSEKSPGIIDAQIRTEMYYVPPAKGTPPAPTQGSVEVSCQGGNGYVQQSGAAKFPEPERDPPHSTRAAKELWTTICGPAVAQAAALTETYKGILTTRSEVPPATGSGGGGAVVNFDPATKRITYNITYTALSGPALAAHIHCGAPAGANSGVAVAFPHPASPIAGSAILTEAQAADLAAGKCYVNIHTATYKAGELRAQLLGTSSTSSPGSAIFSSSIPTQQQSNSGQGPTLSQLCSFAVNAERAYIVANQNAVQSGQQQNALKFEQEDAKLGTVVQRNINGYKAFFGPRGRFQFSDYVARNPAVGAIAGDYTLNASLDCPSQIAITATFPTERAMDRREWDSNLTTFRSILEQLNARDTIIFSGVAFFDVHTQVNFQPNHFTHIIVQLEQLRRK